MLQYTLYTNFFGIEQIQAWNNAYRTYYTATPHQTAYKSQLWTTVTNSFYFVNRWEWRNGRNKMKCSYRNVVLVWWGFVGSSDNKIDDLVNNIYSWNTLLYTTLYALRLLSVGHDQCGIRFFFHYQLLTFDAEQRTKNCILFTRHAPLTASDCVCSIGFERFSSRYRPQESVATYSYSTKMDWVYLMIKGVKLIHIDSHNFKPSLAKIPKQAVLRSILEHYDPNNLRYFLIAGFESRTTALK